MVARCKQCQTKIKIPSPAVVPPTSNPPSSEPTQPASPQAGEENLFGDLPEFQSFQHSIVKPYSTTDDFSQAMYDDSPLSSPRQGLVSDRVTVSPGADKIPPAPQPSPGHIDENLSEVLAGLEGTINDSVAKQLKRNAAAIAPKFSVGEIQSAFCGELTEFDHTAKVDGRLTSVAIAMIAFPLAFSFFVVCATVVMIWLPLSWGPDENESFSVSFTMLAYPLLAGLLIAAWIPVFNLILAVPVVLFHRESDNDDALEVTPENQPVLYEFVSQICKKVGAPSPSKIRLDCDFNASASFRQGWMNAREENLVLTLGIPLIACQNGGQLASVVAHEFGHFRQGSAMRSSCLIRSLTSWFINRAIYGDLRSQAIEYYQDSEDADNPFLAIGSMLGYLGRRMMWAFGYSGHALSGSLSRDMEYDADRHAVHLAGTKNFITSMAKVERYGVAHGVTIENLRMLYQSQGLMVDNLPRFMLHIGKTMPAEVIRRIAEEKQKEKQQQMDTHPPTRDRVEAAKEINQAGIFRMERPASDLLRNWKQVCESNTRQFYTQVLDRPVTQEEMTKLEDVLCEEHKLLLDRASQTTFTSFG